MEIYSKRLIDGIKFYTDNYKDEGITIFDANGDGKPDLYMQAADFKMNRK